LVIATGLLIGTAFTLFMVPTVYTWLAHEWPASALPERLPGPDLR
jgi:hypothetical protein